MRTAVLVVAALVVASPGARADVLCKTRSGTVKLRATCKPSETPIDPAAFGLCCTSTSTSTTATTTSTTTSVTVVNGVCSFKRTPCTVDADCSLPGLCGGGDAVP